MDNLLPHLRQQFANGAVQCQQTTRDEIPTLWIKRERLTAVLRFLQNECSFAMLYDLTAIDERDRAHREGQPEGDFTAVYHLLSFDHNSDVRLKVALNDNDLTLPTITPLWPNANWYEREVWDMFGITFDGHPHLERILLPPTWQGHPLRKEHPARATEMPLFQLPPEKQAREQAALQFHPEEWGLARAHADTDFMFLNIGPQHPGTHGVLRIILQLDGEAWRVCCWLFHDLFWGRFWDQRPFVLAPFGAVWRGLYRTYTLFLYLCSCTRPFLLLSLSERSF